MSDANPGIPVSVTAAPAPATTASAGTRRPGVAPARLLVILSFVPLPVLYMLATAAAFLAVMLMHSRRRIVLHNLSSAFPDLSAEARQKLMKTFARNLADVAAEAVKAYRMTAATLNERVRINNIEILDRFARANQSIVMVASHEANWEWILHSCGSRSPLGIHAVYAPAGNASIDAFLRATRSRFGASMLTRHELGRELIAGRDKLRAIVLTVDGKPLPKDDSHWVHFLNQETAFRSRFETLARLWQYPVVFVARRRIARGHYEVTFEVLGEPPYDSQPFHLVERYAQSLQRSIIASPADWLWTQRRWSATKPFYH